MLPLWMRNRVGTGTHDMILQPTPGGIAHKPAPEYSITGAPQDDDPESLLHLFCVMLLF
jgi:hypothetical protein